LECNVAPRASIVTSASTAKLAAAFRDLVARDLDP